MTFDNDCDREDHEHRISDDVAPGHCQELNEALAALSTRVGQYLIIIVEGPAFNQI